MAGDDHLGNPFSGNNLEGRVRQVHEDDTDFTAVIGIDGAGGVQDRDAMLEGKAAAGPHLRFETLGQGNVQPCGNKGLESVDLIAVNSRNPDFCH